MTAISRRTDVRKRLRVTRARRALACHKVARFYFCVTAEQRLLLLGGQQDAGGAQWSRCAVDHPGHCLLTLLWGKKRADPPSHFSAARWRTHKADNKPGTDCNEIHLFLPLGSVSYTSGQNIETPRWKAAEVHVDSRVENRKCAHGHR